MKKFLYLFFIITGTQIQSKFERHDKTSFYTYNNQRLTPKNLYDLAPKLKGKKLDTFKKWIKDQNIKSNKNPNPFDIDRLLKTPFLWSQIGTLDTLNLRQIHNKFKAMGKSNYVFKVDDLNYVLKISSFNNRLWNIVRGKWGTIDGFYAYGNGTLTLDKLNTIDRNTKSYQTASRAAYYLVLKEAVKKNNLKSSVVLPKLYIFTLDGTSDVSDQNTIIIEDIEDMGQEIETYLQSNTLAEKVIKDFAQAIVDANLWNLHGNLFVKDGKTKLANKQLYTNDLEQPNKTRPQDAFLTQDNDFFNGTDIEWNTMTGLQQFYEILTNSSNKENQGKILQDWVQNGPSSENLKKSKLYPNILKAVNIETNSKKS